MNCNTFLMSLAERESETFLSLGLKKEKQSRLIAIIWTSRVEPINCDFLPAERIRLMS